MRAYGGGGELHLHFAAHLFRLAALSFLIHAFTL